MEAEGGGTARAPPVVRGAGAFAANAAALRRSIARCASRDAARGHHIVFMGAGSDARPPEPPTPYVVVQMEVPGSPAWEGREPDALQGAAAVWDFSAANALALRETHGSALPHVSVVPLWASTDRATVRGCAAAAPAAGYACDVLLFGPRNDRRRDFEEALTARGLRVRLQHFDDALEQASAVASARLIANVHFYERAPLEVHSINPLLAAGRAVLSERSSDAALDAEYEECGAIAFADAGDAGAFAEAAVQLLEGGRDAELRQAGTELAQRRVNEYPHALEDALRRLGGGGEPPSGGTDADWDEWLAGGKGVGGGGDSGEGAATGAAVWGILSQWMLEQPDT